jgi:hypothetical protein
MTITATANDTTQLNLCKAVKAEHIRNAAYRWNEMKRMEKLGLDTPQHGYKGHVFVYQKKHALYVTEYFWFIKQSQEARVARGYRQDGLGIWALS